MNLATVEVWDEHRNAQNRCWGIKSKAKEELGCDQKRVLVKDRERVRKRRCGLWLVLLLCGAMKKIYEMENIRD